MQKLIDDKNHWVDFSGRFLHFINDDQDIMEWMFHMWTTIPYEWLYQ